MKLKKFGMKGLWYSTKSIASLFQKNCKLELAVILLGVFLIIFSENHPKILQFLEYYFSDSRCSGIVSYLAIAIGIYATVWSVFATSVSKINEQILKEKIEGQLFLVISVGIFESLIAVIFSVFIPSIFSLYTSIFLILATLASVSFIKFMIMLLRITNINMKFIVKEIDEQNRRNTELSTRIDEIYQSIIKERK